MNSFLSQFDPTNPTAYFYMIANSLMNEWVISSNKNRYRIAEIEFYLKTDKHFDIYTHGKEIQKRSGCWYIHPSGIDYTIGNENMYASILIRAIQKTGMYNNIENGGYTYGPINVLTEVFSNMNAFEGTLTLRLESAIKDDIIIPEKPIAAPRVGLNSKKDKETSEKLYRFLILPKKKHANKTQITEAMRLNGYTETDIDQIWG